MADKANGSRQTTALTATVVGVAQAVFSPTSLNFDAVNFGSSIPHAATIGVIDPLSAACNCSTLTH